jgi:hypothetical protein
MLVFSDVACVLLVRGGLIRALGVSLEFDIQT